MKTGSTIDYYVLAIFFLILVGIGFYFAKMMKGGKDYFSGGNQLPWWVSGISMYTASFSAWTFTGAAGFVYSTEWFGIIYFSTWSIAYLIGSQITAGRWRRTRGISPVEYTKTRYNQATQQVIGYVVVINAIVGLGVGLAAVSKIIGYAMNIQIEIVIVISGLAILVYTFLGGLWAVAIADVVKFIIIISITIIIFPLAISHVGGFGALVNKLGPVNFNQTYKGENYSVIWLFALLMSNIFGSANQAQKYYSVQDEKSARKVGLTCGLLFITVPILFGTPPLVAKALWPDLSVVPFFQTQLVPAESVYIAVVLQILPNGLIGIFLAAMLAATFSALDGAYNATAAILAKDLFAGIFRPNATDKQIMKFGRVSTLTIGIITIGTALLYASSQFGLFNLSMTFLSLFFFPMTIPTVLGLVFKSLKRWSGLATIIFGLIISVVFKYLLGWPFGWQIVALAAGCVAFLLGSNPLSEIYKKNKKYSALISLAVAIFLALLFSFTIIRNVSSLDLFLIYLTPCLIGISIYFLSKLYASETEEDQKVVDEFFVKLSTPIDVHSEVYSKGVKQISAFPIIGKITILMGCLISLLAFINMTSNEIWITLSLSLILIIIGSSMSFFGGRSQKKYLLKMEEDLKRRGN